MHNFNIDVCIITRGENGMILSEGDQITRIPTIAQEVFDVSGAGDTVISTFALCDLSGADSLEAATIANYAAGRVCEEVGVVPITLNMLNEIVENYRDKLLREEENLLKKKLFKIFKDIIWMPE